MKQSRTTSKLSVSPNLLTAFQKMKAFPRAFISGMWIVDIMRQVIVTGGNIAESCFLLATLWVIINAVAHTLLTWFIPVRIIELINYLAVIAFSALPELIIIPVVIICFSHWVTSYKQKSKVSFTWGVLYTIPASFFLVMTILAITTFVSTGGTHLVPASGIQLVIRCLAGWLYAVVNMLFQRLGEPHYASKFEALETVIDSQRDEMENLQRNFETTLNEMRDNFKMIIESKQTEIDRFQNLLTSQSEQVKRLAEKASSLELRGLENYPKVISEWIERGVKTVSIEDILSVTGQSKRRINNAKLQRHSRNKDLIMVSSVIDWLKNAPLPEVPIISNGHAISDTDPLGLPVFVAE